jgi:hypothetical protein
MLTCSSWGPSQPELFAGLLRALQSGDDQVQGLAGEILVNMLGAQPAASGKRQLESMQRMGGCRWQ